MKIDTLPLGDFQTNCFVLRISDDSNECIVIDPGFDAEPLIDLLHRKSLRPKKILLTHGHCDHIAGLGLLKENYHDFEVIISKDDAVMLNDDSLNLSIMMGMSLKFDPADVLVDHGDTIEFVGMNLDVLATPGHTPGGISFYCREEQTVFSGDALFAGGIGRTDFPGGNLEVLLESIRQQLFTLPDETKVYSGHGPETTIGQEKMSNPFLR